MLTVATLQLCAAMSLAAPSTPSAALRHRPVLLAMQQGTKPDVHKQDAQEQKISLSIRAVNDKAERAALKELAEQQSATQTTTLGDLLAEKLKGQGD